MSSGGWPPSSGQPPTFDVKTCTKTLQVCGQTPANRIARHRMSAIASPPPASITATSTSTRPAVVSRNKSPTRRRLADVTRQPGLIGLQTQTNTAGVGHHAGPVTGYRQASRPRSTLHLRSACQPGLLGTSQVQESHAGQALPCFYTLTAAISREQSGLTVRHQVLPQPTQRFLQQPRHMHNRRTNSSRLTCENSAMGYAR